MTLFDYDALDNLKSLTDAEGKETRYTFDAYGRLYETIYPDHAAGTQAGDADYGIVTTEYDERGSLLRRTDQFGDTVTFNYDLAGRLVRRDYRERANSPDGSITDSDTFSYDQSGNLLCAESGRYDNMTLRVYDAASRITHESLVVNGQTYHVFTQYSGRGQIAGYIYPDGKVQTRAYHPDGGLDEVYHDGELVDRRLYDVAGRLIQSHCGNNVKTYHTYRDDSLLDSITINYPDSILIDAMDYTYDANKNLLSEVRHGLLSGYGFPSTVYDAGDRLISWQRTDDSLSQSWDLSLVGDWDSVTENGNEQFRSHTSAHEIFTVTEGGTTASVTHDAKGNTTFLPASLATETLSLTYDYDNRMSSGSVGGETITYRFDALGRRIGRVFSGSAEPETIFVQAGQQTLADYESGSAPSLPSYSYVYGSYIDEVLMRTGGGERLYYHRNHQYSIVALTDVAGVVKERYAYDAYGTLTILDATLSPLTASAENNRYLYTGREWDEELGLYHYRARMYSAKTGWFCSRDPIGYVDGASLYRAYFVLLTVDPFGLSWFGGIVGGISGAVGGAIGGAISTAIVAGGVVVITTILVGGTIVAAPVIAAVVGGAIVGGIVGGIAGGIVGGIAGSDREDAGASTGEIIIESGGQGVVTGILVGPIAGGIIDPPGGGGGLDDDDDDLDPFDSDPPGGGISLPKPQNVCPVDGVPTTAAWIRP